MKVNISYTVDLEELPNKVVGLLKQTNDNLESIWGNLTQLLDTFDERDLIDNIEVIDEYRQELALIDAQLGDFSAILAGYQKAKAELYLAEQEKERHLNGEISEDAQKLIEQIEENHNDKTEGNISTE